jgi:hypothetical protein
VCNRQVNETEYTYEGGQEMPDPPKPKEAKRCHFCLKNFGFIISGRHHCRNCGHSCCQACSQDTRDIKAFDLTAVRVCGPCAKKIDAEVAPQAPPVSMSAPEPKSKAIGTLETVHKT